MENSSPQQMRTGQVGLSHLLMMIAFVMPTFATIAEVKHSSGGTSAYILAIPIGIALSIAIATAEWRLGKFIWLRFKESSERVQNAVGALLFALQMLWIFTGLVGGMEMGVFISYHLAR
jgi:hypothetical protein